MCLGHFLVPFLDAISCLINLYVYFNWINGYKQDTAYIRYHLDLVHFKLNCISSVVHPLITSLLGLFLLCLGCYVFLTLTDIPSQEIFKNCCGPKLVMNILDGSQSSSILNSGFAAVAAAAAGNEVLKQSFMELKIDELMMRILTKQSKLVIPSLYDAIRILLTADDNRVIASQVSQGFRHLFFLHALDLTLSQFQYSLNQRNSSI